tara:strand:+ start:235 stop:1446 length:1212 start_codon:yes stop_codon:yes gene_type:complete
MKNSIINFDQLIEIGNNKLIENIKILIYKENKNLFDLLDFYNDEIFKEPLLFAYFSSKKKLISLDQLLYGYITPLNRPSCIEVISDEKGKIYLPNIGWFNTSLIQKIIFLKKTENEYVLEFNKKVIECSFEPIMKLKNNKNLELIQYNHTLLSEYYRDSEQNNIQVEIKEVAKKQKHNLEKAFELIFENIPSLKKQLISTLKKVVIFNDPSVKRNSFAILSVHNTIFLNAFQENYNEVFFIEDISHQGGHVIFNTIISGQTNVLFKADSNLRFTNTGLATTKLEGRTLFVIIHALFTYYLITQCLDACIDNKVFDCKHKLHEAIGRLAFVVIKFKIDLKLLNQTDSDGNNLYLTDQGMLFFNLYKSHFTQINEKWKEKIINLKLTNQPYNFSYQKFLKLNPLK